MRGIFLINRILLSNLSKKFLIVVNRSSRWFLSYTHLPIRIYLITQNNTQNSIIQNVNLPRIFKKIQFLKQTDSEILLVCLSAPWNVSQLMEKQASKMKLRRFPPENVHKRTGKGADKSHDRCRIRRSTTCYTTEKARRLSPSRFSVACSLACREDVIFVRWLSYSCSFLIKMRFRQEKKSRDD